MQTRTAERGRATAATPSLAFNMGFGCTPLYQAKNRRGVGNRIIGREVFVRKGVVG